MPSRGSTKNLSIQLFLLRTSTLSEGNIWALYVLLDKKGKFENWKRKIGNKDWQMKISNKDTSRVVSSGHSRAFYVVFVPLKYIPTTGDYIESNISSLRSNPAWEKTFLVQGLCFHFEKMGIQHKFGRQKWTIRLIGNTDKTKNVKKQKITTTNGSKGPKR